MGKILIIEDETAIRRVLVKIITEEYANYEVLEAGDGLEGLEYIKNQELDLVLCDFYMPKMNGLEVLKNMKRLKPHIPYMMISGRGNLDTAVSVMKQGAYDYISKPPDLNKMLSAIENGLSGNVSKPAWKNKTNQTSKILIIDDDAEVRRKLINILKREVNGYKFVETEDGLQGIETFERQDFDLVLCDIKMPRMDGIEVLERARKSKPHIPIIMMSDDQNIDTAVHTIKLGAFDYLSKPMDLNRMLSSVHDALSYTEEDKEKSTQEGDFIAVAFIEGRLKCIRIKRDMDYALLDNNHHFHNILYPNFLEVVHLRHAVQEFEYLINNPKTTEQDLQVFFESNPEFILNDDYRGAHSKIVLSDAHQGNLIPDFILEPYNNKQMSDLLELKLPKAKIYTLKKNRYKYSSAVHEACAQLREYALYFDEAYNRNKILQKHGLHLYKPNMLVIIGRQSDLSPIQIKKIHNDLPNLKLTNYDEIYDRMKRKIN